jgi:hypothetical protein
MTIRQICFFWIIWKYRILHSLVCLFWPAVPAVISFELRFLKTCWVRTHLSGGGMTQKKKKNSFCRYPCTPLLRYKWIKNNMSIHLGILLFYLCVMAWNKIMSTFSNVDIVLTFKYHFCLFKMELCLSGADSYLIQIFKWTLKSWELIAANSLFHAIFTTLAAFSPS